MPEMNNVAEYMLFSTRDRNETVALEACEFWLTFAEEEELSRSMQPFAKSGTSFARMHGLWRRRPSMA